MKKTIAKERSGQNIALIGCGAIAERYYLPALARHPMLLQNLVLVDRDQNRLEMLSKSFQIKNTNCDYREVMHEIDGAIIALPTGMHASIGIDFLSNGIPILCEKPLAENFYNAHQMVVAAKKYEVGLAVNYLQRVVPHFARVKELLESNTWGAPLYIDYVVGEIFNWPTVSGFYFKENRSSRGILRDRGAHAVDHICWWLGCKPEVVSSFNDSFGGSEAVARIDFMHGGCVGQLTLSWFADVPCRFVINCEKATLEGDIYDYQHLKIIQNGETKVISMNSPLISKIDVAEQIVLNFYKVINKEKPPLVSGEDVLASIEFIDECYKVAKPFHMPWYEITENQNVIK